jgi:folate-binding protein YgfZ
MKSSSSAGVFGWRPSCWLAVRGSDAATFLQGQFTNDLRNAQDAVYGLWLNTKGKVIADSFVIPQPDRTYRICSYNCPAATIRERLESHIIADDVEIADETASVSGITVIGSDAMAIADELVASTGGIAFAGHRFRDPHVECVFPQSAAAAVQARVGSMTAVSVQEIERRRIAAVTPSIPRDIGPTDLPNEGGLDQVAISFTKGCYLGQEVMARLKNLGQVRRKLLRVEGPLPSMPPLPSPLYRGERVVGELRSAICEDGQLQGLALVTLMHIEAGVRLALAADDEGVLTVDLNP